MRGSTSEQDQPLLRLGFAVDRERDADAAEQELGLAPPIFEHVVGISESQRHSSP
jgi:hypothetical protein